MSRKVYFRFAGHTDGGRLQVTNKRVFEFIFLLKAGRRREIDTFLSVESVVDATDDGCIQFMGILLFQINQSFPDLFNSG